MTPPVSPASSTQDQTSHDVSAALPVKQFVWGAGVECSFIPHLNVDQFDWTQHNRFWREDLARLRNDLGVDTIRYAFPWHVLEAERGHFDWSYSDERVEACNKLGLKLMLDVMHFGTPLWLKQAVGDPEFPEALEHFAHAIVERYRDSIQMWCPFNEPLVSALFSGDFGFWPPHARKWRGYMPVLSRIVQGVNRSIRAIRQAHSNAVVVLCDAAEAYKSRNKELASEVRRRNLRRFLVMDLLTGRVDKHHPLFSWLTSYGMSELDIEWFRTNPQCPDVLGLDYYTHSDWQLEMTSVGVRQRRAENPIGLHGVASAYWQRYGVPMMLTETSIEGKPINREIWLESNIEHIKRLREDGVPMLGLFWWPAFDQVDWDGALTHRIGKVHEVGLFNLKRQKDGTLLRQPSALIKLFREYVERGEESVGTLQRINFPSNEAEEEQLPPIGQWIQPIITIDQNHLLQEPGTNGDGKVVVEATPAGLSGEPVRRAHEDVKAHGSAVGLKNDEASSLLLDLGEKRSTDRYGIVVFSHLRWGFVWQRPQQFLSRFAKQHPILFVEEPFFDLQPGAEIDVQYHRVMPNVSVLCPHLPPEWNRDPRLPEMLRNWTRVAIEEMNEGTGGAFDPPLLWYYSPMDSAWSLGHFPHRGVVYDCMDELSNFTGAPKALIANEARLMEHADIVFTGGYEMGEKRKKLHPNVHIFGCGVEFDHFNKASDPTTIVPPDIDFMARPILGWFGVVDERVDYAMIGEMARMKTNWSFAMVGPVVKVDPNLLPHAPNLFWMGGRDYEQLPNYCAAFDFCMMPFAMNASTQYINPTKGLEYMATGRPIISTPVKDVVRQWSDIVTIANNASEFVAAAENWLRHPDHSRIERGLAKARESSWESTVAHMQELIKQAISSAKRNSVSKKIEPLSQAELSYQYQHTQGS